MRNRGVAPLPMELRGINELGFKAGLACIPHNIGYVGAAGAGIQKGDIR